MPSCRRASFVVGAGLLGACALGAQAPAQQDRAAPPARPAPTRSVDPRADTLSKLMRPITVELTDQRLEDVIAFIAQTTGASLDVKWSVDGRDGLDPEAPVTLKVENVPALTLIERALEKTQLDSFSEATWQLAPTGELEVGPKSVLNRSAFVKLYDINDLLFQIPSFTDFPSLDLDSVLNQREGGGSGSIFQDTDTEGEPRASSEELAMQVIDIIITVVEPEQWIDNGGAGASIRHYNNTLLVRAPDYIHRQIDGYSFWRQQESRPAARYTRYGPGAAETGAQAPGAPPAQDSAKDAPKK